MHITVLFKIKYHRQGEGRGNILLISTGIMSDSQQGLPVGSQTVDLVFQIKVLIEPKAPGMIQHIIAIGGYCFARTDLLDDGRIPAAVFGAAQADAGIETILPFGMRPAHAEARVQTAGGLKGARRLPQNGIRSHLAGGDDIIKSFPLRALHIQIGTHSAFTARNVESNETIAIHALVHACGDTTGHA